MYYERRQIVEDLRKVADNDTIVKVAIYFKKEKAEEFMKYFENIGEKLTAVLSGASWIDIANKTESKGMQSKLYVKSTALHIQKLWDLVTI